MYGRQLTEMTDFLTRLFRLVFICLQGITAPFRTAAERCIFMCGIVGFTGKTQAAGFLLEGLERLEYRGYDSAGIAVLNDNNLTV